MYLKILWKVEHLVFWSKCFIPKIFSKVFQTLIFLEFFQCCLKKENDAIV